MHISGDSGKIFLRCTISSFMEIDLLIHFRTIQVIIDTVTLFCGILSCLSIATQSRGQPLPHTVTGKHPGGLYWNPVYGCGARAKEPERSFHYPYGCQFNCLAYGCAPQGNTTQKRLPQSGGKTSAIIQREKEPEGAARRQAQRLDGRSGQQDEVHWVR